MVGAGGTGAAVGFIVFEWSYIFDLTTSLNLADTWSLSASGRFTQMGSKSPNFTAHVNSPCDLCKFLAILLPGSLWFCSSPWVNHPDLSAYQQIHISRNPITAVIPSFIVLSDGLRRYPRNSITYSIVCPLFRGSLNVVQEGPTGVLRPFQGISQIKTPFITTLMWFAFPLLFPRKCTVEFSSVYIMSDDVTVLRADGVCILLS